MPQQHRTDGVEFVVCQVQAHFSQQIQNAPVTKEGKRAIDDDSLNSEVVHTLNTHSDSNLVKTHGFFFGKLQLLVLQSSTVHLE